MKWRLRLRPRRSLGEKNHSIDGKPEAFRSVLRQSRGLCDVTLRCIVIRCVGPKRTQDVLLLYVNLLRHFFRKFQHAFPAGIVSAHLRREIVT